MYTLSKHFLPTFPHKTPVLHLRDLSQYLFINDKVSDSKDIAAPQDGEFK
jgi:hypothetical protein